MAHLLVNSAQNSDQIFISQWLTENKLQSLSAVLIENDITREDLLGLSINTCDALAFCQDYGVRHVVKNRFIQALDKMSLKEAPKNDPKIASQLTEIDLSTEERELMNKIDQQKKDNQARMDKIEHLLKNVVNQQTSINDTYDALIQSLNDRKRQTKNAMVTKPFSFDTNDDHKQESFAFKPIVQLEETKVATGHEDETLIVKVPFLKLYRFGKDVTQEPCWKQRASKSSVYFYKSNTNGKIRIIARENETNKLRMNQFVPKSGAAAFELRQNKVYQWMAYDSSIASEEQKDTAGFTLWCIKFENTDYAETFAKTFKKAMKSNDSSCKEQKLSINMNKAELIQFPEVLETEHVSLEEVEVESGHNDDRLLQEFEILKLNRWGKDDSGAACWKARASETLLQFYQDNDAGKIRIVCRENITNELRLDQVIAAPKEAYLLRKTAKEVQWTECDATIEEEEYQDDKKGCLWIAKFADEETATKFQTFFESSSQSNSINK